MEEKRQKKQNQFLKGKKIFLISFFLLFMTDWEKDKRT